MEIFLLVARGENIPGLTTSRDTVCFGDFNAFLASCPIGAVIYVQDIQAGANIVSTGCPSTYNSSADPCCTVKDDDCTFRLADEGYYNWFSKCNGRRQCDQGGAQQDATSEAKCGTSDFLNIYGQHTQYLYMDYYCVESSRIHGMCTAASQTYTGKSFFLTNQGYPLDIPSGDTDCDCSVEVDDCDANMQIYTLHMYLNQTNGVCGKQDLIVTDGNNTHNITCNDNNIQGIPFQKTSTNYINIRLLNRDGEPGGKFWLGFHTVSTSASMSINCPAAPPTQVCTMNTSTTTTTTTTTTTASTTTTTTTQKTSTTPTTTTSTTTSLTTTTIPGQSSYSTSSLGGPRRTTVKPEDHTIIGFITGLIALAIVIILLATCLLVYCLYSRKKIQVCPSCKTSHMQPSTWIR